MLRLSHRSRWSPVVTRADTGACHYQIHTSFTSPMINPGTACRAPTQKQLFSPVSSPREVVDRKFSPGNPVVAMHPARGGFALPCHYEKNMTSGHPNCDILPSQTRWQSIGHPPESSCFDERLQVPAERLRPHSPAPPPGAWLR